MLQKTYLRAIKFLRQIGRSKIMNPSASNTAGENGPTVIEAAALSESIRVRSDAKRKKNRAAAQNVPQIKSKGES